MRKRQHRSRRGRSVGGVLALLLLAALVASAAQWAASEGEGVRAPVRGGGFGPVAQAAAVADGPGLDPSVDEALRKPLPPEATTATVPGPSFIRGWVVKPTHAPGHEIERPESDSLAQTMSEPVATESWRGTAGIEVSVANDARVLSAASDGSGAFELVGWDVGADAELVLTSRQGVRGVGRAVAWGSKDVVLVWPHTTRAEVTVVDARTRQPVRGAEVKLRFVDRVEFTVPRFLTAKVDRQGCAAFDDLEPGTHQVWVSAPGLTQVELPRLSVGYDTPTRVVVSMDVRSERVLSVQGADGLPVAGARVRLLRPSAAHEPPPSGGCHVGEPGWSGPATERLIVASATTDGHGQCRLAAPAQLATTLVVIDASHTPLVQERVCLGAMPMPWQVGLESGAVLEGRLNDRQPGFLEKVYVRREAGATLALDGHWVGVPGPDGRFRVAGLPGGTWRVCVALRAREVQGAPWQDLDGGIVVADVVDLGAHETRTVEIGLGDVGFADVGVQAYWNGTRCDDGLLLLPTDPMRDRVPVDRRRPVPAARVWSGRYRLVVSANQGRGDLPFPGTIEALPGATSAVVLRLHTRTVRVGLRRMGVPAPGVPVRARIEGAFAVSGKTDAFGQVCLSLPLGVHSMHAQPRRRTGVEVDLGAIAVTAGDGTQEVALELPATWH